jgi:two-component system cell cycle sensor histidine kinase/response regulator CckA
MSTDKNDTELLAHAIAQSNDLVVVSEVDGAEWPGMVVYVNEAAKHRLGYDASEARARSDQLFRSPRSDASALQRLRSAVRAGNGAREELLGATKEGQELLLEVDVAPIKDAKGRTSHYIASARDVAHRKPNEELRERLQEQLFRSQKMESVNALAGGIAHDFNNILTGILGSAELGRMSLTPTHPAYADLETIAKAAQRAALLTKELLAYTGSGKGEEELINLNDIVTNILAILRSQMSRSIIVRKALQPGVPFIEADPVQVKQVMMNLCLNASESMAAHGGILSITTDEAYVGAGDLDKFVHGPPKPGRYATFEVTDTGSGMEAATAKRMFDAFFSTKSEGRGLGLTAALEIVKGYRGGIEVISEPGEGTTFRVYLPASSKQPVADSLREASVNRGTQTILFVDDEEMLRSLAHRGLEQLGYRVILAADGVEAVRLYREHAPDIDLVVLDLSMPRKGGEDAYLEMREIRDDMKVLLCCGYNENIANKKIAAENLVGFLPKPFGIDLLAQTVQAALRKK